MSVERDYGSLFVGGILGFLVGLLSMITCTSISSTATSVPKSDRLNEPCHYGAKPMMVEDGYNAGKHRVVCGCPQ